MPDIAVDAPFVTTGGFIPSQDLLAPTAQRGGFKVELAALAASYGLHYTDLHNLSPSPRYSWPRQHAMAVLRARGWSYPKIGAFFGLDHATAIYGCRRYAERARA